MRLRHYYNVLWPLVLGAHMITIVAATMTIYEKSKRDAAIILNLRRSEAAERVRAQLWEQIAKIQEARIKELEQTTKNNQTGKRK